MESKKLIDYFSVVGIKESLNYFKKSDERGR